MSLETRITALAQAIGADVKALQSVSPSVKRKQPAPNSCENLLVYYGYPIAYLGLWDAAAIIDRIASQYSIWVVGDSYQQPTFEEYASTQTIINGVRGRGVKVYGYIPRTSVAGNCPHRSKWNTEWQYGQ